jgi:hypothetical protein
MVRAARAHVEHARSRRRDPAFEPRALGPDDVARLIALWSADAPSPAVVAAVVRRSAGNPFFVGELLRLLATDDRLALTDAGSALLEIPPGVRDVVLRRLERLTTECRRALSVAAVIGGEIALGVLEATSELERERLLAVVDEAVDARLLMRDAASPARWSFAHSAVRDALFAGLGTAERAALHRRVGEYLEGLDAAEADPPADALAHHFFAALPAGTADKAVLHAVRAAVRAGERLAYEDAVTHYERALEALTANPAATARRRAELLLDLGEALWRAGRGGPARTTLRDAADVAVRARCPELLAKAALRYRGGQFLLIHPADADNLRGLEQARGVLRTDEPRLAARVTTKLALEYLAAGDLERHDALSREAIALARGSGCPATLAAVLIGRHWGLLGSPDLAERLALAEEAVAQAEAAADPEKEAAAHFHRVADLLEIGDLAGVRRTLADERLIARHPRGSATCVRSHAATEPCFVATSRRASARSRRSRSSPADACVPTTTCRGRSSRRPSCSVASRHGSARWKPARSCWRPSARIA